jgi:hypothetical protein
MRQRPTVITAGAALCLAVLTGSGAVAGTQGPATAGRAPLGGTWKFAQEVPGSQTLNVGHHAGVSSVSCASAGNCVAGGYYASGTANRNPIDQAFVVSETNGTWGSAQGVPGAAALNTGGSAHVSSIACPVAGSCSAGGFYTDASGHVQAFVVTQANGTWGTAEEAPGTASLDASSPGAEVTAVSCGAAGDCSAGGFYTDASGHQQAFVLSETNGTWRTAQEVPGTTSLNAGGYAQVNSMSCASAGNCSAGGLYASASVDGVATTQAFVVDETNGTWGSAREVPGTAVLNTGGYAAIYSVSCASAGNCSAGGSFTNRTPATEAFVVNEVNGTWRTARAVPGIASLNKLGLAQTSSVSCASPGNCSAGGFYQDASFHSQAFVVNETGGTWGTAEQVPGTAALNVGTPGAVINSVSCGAAGDCSAVGYYSDASAFEQAFVVSETGGTWGTAKEVPGTAALNSGTKAGTDSVSCPSAGNCSAGGHYTTSRPAQQAFVASETGP